MVDRGSRRRVARAANPINATSYRTAGSSNMNNISLPSHVHLPASAGDQEEGLLELSSSRTDQIDRQMSECG